MYSTRSTNIKKQEERKQRKGFICNIKMLPKSSQIFQIVLSISVNINISRKAILSCLQLHLCLVKQKVLKINDLPLSANVCGINFYFIKINEDNRPAVVAEWVRACVKFM